MNTTGSLAGTLGAIQPFRYRGYVYDEETELYYLRSRYYNTEWTRFLSIDEYVGRGSFNYTSNNCINLIDSEGKEAVLIAYGTVKLLAVAYTGVLALIIGVAVGDATKNSYNVIYTNNPMGYQGAQSFIDFMDAYYVEDMDNNDLSLFKAMTRYIGYYFPCEE